MIREPWFWRSRSLAARALAAGAAPLSLCYDLGQRLRQRLAVPAAAPVPVICVGNATLGGVGKTPFAIALHALLLQHFANCAFLTRGYGGREKGPLRVAPHDHDASDVGDEALLLAPHAPTWIARNRCDGAQEAARAGADAIIMDDGFQNPAIAKTVSILLIDGADPGGNGKIFPAGPLREPLARAKSRADIVVIVGPSRQAAEQAAARNGASFAAWLEPRETPAPERVVAFSGIGRPQKFFASLKAAGFDVAKEVSFPDHYVYSDNDQRALEKLAGEQKARLVTTEKDHVRLHKPFSEQARPFRVVMKINQPETLVAAILRAMPASPYAKGATENG